MHRSILTTVFMHAKVRTKVTLNTAQTNKYIETMLSSTQDEKPSIMLLA